MKNTLCRASSTLLFVAVCLVTNGRVAGQIAPTTRLEVLEHLGVTDGTLLRLPTFANLPDSFEFSVGGIGTVHLNKHSMRANAFSVRVQNTKNELVEAEAPPVRTYRGTMTNIPGAVVSASLDDEGRLTAVITSGTTWVIEPLDDFEAGFSAIYNTADVLPSNGMCGAQGLVIPHNRRLSQAGGIAGVGDHHCQIAFDADYEYFLLNGSSVSETVADIESVMNAVESIFMTETNITYEITQIIVRDAEPDPYTSTNNRTLLDEFGDFWNSNHSDIVRDVAHLMTGKDIDGNVIGTAWIGAVCVYPDFAYGFSQSLYDQNFALRVSLTAHELGHNFNAQHCAQECDGSPGDPDCGIMCPCNGGCISDLVHFGSVPQAAIIAWRDSVGCLNPPMPVVHVPGDFPTIQQALNVVDEGGEVIVARGLYNESIDFQGKSIVLRSTEGPDVTFIDAVGLGTRVVTMGGPNSKAVLQGFSIQHGASSSAGGGIYSTGGGTVIDCHIQHNSGASGGGALAYGTTFVNCIFDQNSATNLYGGGLAVFGGQNIVSGCIFSGNMVAASGQGAGAFVGAPSTATFEHCQFLDNGLITQGTGGALCINGNTNSQGHADIVDCLFKNNKALSGGAVTKFWGTFTMQNCIFETNASTQAGAAIITTQPYPASIANCLFHNHNSGGSVNSASGGSPNVTYVNCTWAKNGITSVSKSSGATVTILNSIIWGNAGAAITGLGTSVVQSSNVQGIGVYPGIQNINENPFYANPSENDFRLLDGSPSVNAGDNSLLPGDDFDLDGDNDFREAIPHDVLGLARVLDRTVDHGAFEGTQPVPPAPNDSCVTPTLVQAGTFTFSNLGATTDGPDEAQACTFIGATQIENDVWFKVIAPCNGTVTVTLCGTNFDAKLAVYASCPSGDDEAIACNDNFCGLAPQVSFGTSAGSEYLIRIGGPFGEGTMTISCAPAFSPDHDTCANALLKPAGSHAFSTLGATTQGPDEPQCNFGGENEITNDVWFRYVPLCNGTATVSVCGANFDTRIAIYGNSCPGNESGTAIACNDDFCGDDAQVTFPVIAGQTVRIRVGGARGVTGQGTLVISCHIGCFADITGNGVVNVDDLLSVINSWGPCAGCPADVSPLGGNGIVNVDDLLLVINNWGACP